MARSSRRRSSKGKSQEAGWKKSKLLTGALILIIPILWYNLFFGGKSSVSHTFIPQAYYCEDCRKLTVITEPPKEPYLPYTCEHCKKKTAWRAYTCSECIDEDTNENIIFGNIIDFPEGVIAPKGKEQPSMEYMTAMMSAEGMMPECPICEKTETVTPYMTPEAKKMLDDLRKKYSKKKKKK